jgi:hypothetical protein
MIKTIILTLSLFISQQLMANTWAFVKVNGEYYLQTPNGSNHSVVIETGIPKIEKIEDLSESLSKITYYAGEAGTSQIIEIYRAALFNKTNQKIIGDYPSHYKGEAILTQPEWTIKNDQLIIKDKNEDIEVKIQLSQLK